MKNRIFSSILSLFILLVTASATLGQALERTSPEDVGMSTERLEILSANLQEYVDNGELPGSSLLVARKGKIAYFETFGMQDRETDDPGSG